MKGLTKISIIAPIISLIVSSTMPVIALAAPVDSVNPVVSISAPNNSSIVSGSVTISANASDVFSNCVVRIFGQSYDVSVLGSTHSGGNVFNCGTNMDAVYSSQHGTNTSRIQPYLIPSSYVGVTKVEFYVDGNLLATDVTSPYSVIWNTSNISNGSHSIIAKAYDGSRIGTSATVNVTVNNSGQTPVPTPTTTPNPSPTNTTTPNPSPTTTVSHREHDDEDDDHDDEDRYEKRENKQKKSEKMSKIAKKELIKKYLEEIKLLRKKISMLMKE